VQRKGIQHIAAKDAVILLDDEELPAKDLAQKMQFQPNSGGETSRAVEAFELEPRFAFESFHQGANLRCRQERDIRARIDEQRDVGR
jgi:hypothetical protein